jgi:streptomycin 6-kinase
MRSVSFENTLVPPELREKVARVHGERGRQWLANVPALVNECRQRWSLQLDKPFVNLAYNLVIPGRTSKGVEVVLKLGVPCRELTTEAQALEFFAANGAAGLLDHDTSLGALLMERAIPGTLVCELQNETDSAITAARLMKRLWREPAAGHSFPSLAVWFSAFERFRPHTEKLPPDEGSIPLELIVSAKQIVRDLLTATERTVILHGDLHHANILFSEDHGWVAIDPKGVAGDPAYDVASFMLNLVPRGAPDSVVKELLNQRLSIFSSELGMKRELLVRWAFCHAVLSALWDLEESADPSHTIFVAKIMKRLCCVI